MLNKLYPNIRAIRQEWDKLKELCKNIYRNSDSERYVTRLSEKWKYSAVKQPLERSLSWWET